MMTKSKKSLLTTVIVVFAALTAALLLVFCFGAPTAASADDGAVSGIATVKVGENAAVEYDSIEEAWGAANAATSPATVKMFADAITTDTLTVESGKNITLDLNGHTLEYGNDSAYNPVITVYGTFTLKDGSTAQNGVITGGTGQSSDQIRGGGVFVDGGAFTMLSGTICGNSAEQGGGVNVNNRGAFTMTGGYIRDNSAPLGIGGGVCVAGSSEFTMIGGAISGNTVGLFGAEKGGGGVCVAYSGAFTMKGGTIGSEEGDANVATFGGGIYVDRGGKFIMENGTVMGNSAYSGGGVFVSNNGEFKISGGIISENDMINNGGGVSVEGGRFSMTGGMISRNTYCDGANTANYGGGVYVVGTFIMSGTAVISCNMAAEGAGVYVGGDSSFTMENGVITDNTSDWDGGGVCVGCWFSADGVHSGIFTMNDGIISGNISTGGGGVNIENECVFTMSGGEIKDNRAYEGDGGGVQVWAGKFEMKGGTISGNTTTAVYDDDEEEYIGGYGGGVCIDGFFDDEDGIYYGTFKMTDGVISGNTADYDGGGVFINEAEFIMSGGAILENTATSAYDEYEDMYVGGNGGGVYVSAGVFKLIRAPIIMGNTAMDGSSNTKSANDVWLYDDSIITVAGALTDGAEIGVFNNGNVATGYTQSDSPSQFFIPDDPTNDCVYISNEDNGTVSIGVHDYADEPTVDKEATCTEDGSQSIHCKGCDSRKDEEVIAALDHDFGEFTVDKEPTCTEEGVKSRQCSRCDEKTEVTMPTIPHTLTHVPEKPATEDKDGNKEYWDCEDCDKIFSDEEGKQEITDKSSVVVPKLKDKKPSDDNSLLWIILIAVLGAVVLCEIAVIIYRARRNAKAKEKN